MSEEEAQYTIGNTMDAMEDKPSESIEGLKHTIAYLHVRYEQTWDRANRFMAEMQRWEAKFRQVAHENNQLRKALHQQ